ncbi:MAG: 16S rRNA (cytosine(1402)-N(4))-methyltransferase RsmH [Thermoanaerobacteraceae bacterium]|nr:16S rRNA (cytosine(1402)-N(4))-methyltransferase RsmH [Thermoanaerobacteraceae bacterium]
MDEHKPVLLMETVELLNVKKDGIYVDGTIGSGGHAMEILKRLENGKLIGIDRDRNAMEIACKNLNNYMDKLVLIKDNFKNIKNIIGELGIDRIDGVVLDLGFSSIQVDDPARGFSYQSEGPLDMRMDEEEILTAKDIVNKWSEKDIAKIISEYGEEKWSSRIAKFIVEAREKQEISTTTQLAEIIKSAIPARARRSGPHPAKRTFQALRIAVNSELNMLHEAILDFVDILKPGGRICIISFHSLEDRIVKQTFKKLENPCICKPDVPVCVCGQKQKLKLITKKPILPDLVEIEKNPRARSARLRVGERVET